MITRFLALAAGALLAVSAHAQEPVASGADSRSDLSLTIYNGGRAMVREMRRIDLPRGPVRLELADVSARIMADTALLEADAVAVLEQNFDFDLLTPRALLGKAVGQRVDIYRPHPTTGEDRVEHARVLAANEGVIVEIDGRIEILERLPGRIVFADLPPKLRARPTLSTLLDVEAGGGRDVSLTYLTEGLSWEADYIGVLSPDETRLELTGWITLTNTSGTDFADATTQLVAGDLNLVREVTPQQRDRGVTVMRALGSEEVREEALADFHLYTLPRRTTIADKQTKQVRFLRASGVHTEKLYRAVRRGFSTDREAVSMPVFVRIANTASAGLGQPLPAGVMRLYAADSEGRLQFIGEDRNRHTPEGGRVTLAMGRAFDVTIEGTALARDLIRASRDGDIYEAEQRYVLKNARDRAVTVIVEQFVPGRDWRILEESHLHAEAGADRVLWRVDMPADSETVLQFRLRVEE